MPKPSLPPVVVVLVRVVVRVVGLPVVHRVRVADVVAWCSPPPTSRPS